MQSDKREIISDEKCKIFSVSHPEVNLAYGIFGTATIADSFDNVLFNFEAESGHAFENTDRSLNWWQYLNSFAATMVRALNDARAKCGQPLDAHMLTHGTYVVIGGFYGRFQKLAHIEFKHRAERSEAEIKNYPPGFSFPFGSIKVFELMNAGDDRFSCYSRPSRNNLRTLTEGIERVRNDIIAHYDPQALEVDGDTCRGIGGRVQIATVTVAEGFKWVPGFESKT